MLALLFVLLRAAPVAAREIGPEELVKRVTAQVLDALNSDAGLQAGDRQKALALAEQKVLPHVDFEEAARLAGERAWALANPEQRTRLANEFRAMLVRIYSGAIEAYRGQTMKVLSTRLAPGATETEVRNQYLRPGAPPVSVIYAMRKTPAGWKIHDINVEGISLVLTFRGEFDQIARRSGIEGLIERLTEKNKPAALN